MKTEREREGAFSESSAVVATLQTQITEGGAFWVEPWPRVTVLSWSFPKNDEKKMLVFTGDGWQRPLRRWEM